MIVVPSVDYWTKKTISSLEDRINMLKLYESDRIIIDTKNNTCEYTYLVLNNISKDYPNDELYLIMGADNIIRFGQWKNFNDIIKHKIIVVGRNGIDIDSYVDKLGHQEQFIIIKNYPESNASSTEIRNGVYTYLDDQVKEYITTHNLYQS